jgi:endonuclease/exonuclease/phosphatase family metal-dependent hydrolase
MKIISLNTWRGQCREALTQYIRHHKNDTDIFLFQEANFETDEIRQAELRSWPSVTVRKEEIHYDEEWCQTSIFRPGWQLAQAGTFFMTDEDQGIGLWTEFLYQGETYFICNIHGTSLPSEKIDTPARLRQSEEIIAFLRGKPGKHIIMGDFNLFPDTESVKLFEAAGYRNLIQEYSIGTTRNQLAWELFPDNPHLFADYTFVSHNVEVGDFQVPKNLVSDHLPMELTCDSVRKEKEQTL